MSFRVQFDFETHDQYLAASHEIAHLLTPSRRVDASMAGAFVGLNVTVSLKDPPTTLHGLVADVKSQRLFLTDVQFVDSDKHLKEYTVHGTEIADIEVLPGQAAAAAAAQQGQSTSTQKPLQQDQQQQQQKSSSVPTASATSVTSGGTSTMRPAQVAPNKPTGPKQAMLQDPAILSFSQASSGQQQQSRYHSPYIPSADRNVDRRLSASLQAPLNALEISEAAPAVPAGGDSGIPPDDQASYEGNRPTASKPRRRRRRRTKDRDDTNIEPAPAGESSPEATKAPQDPAIPSSGWRQTPIIHSPAGGSLTRPTPRSAGRRSALAKKTGQGNEWATGDASDVHGMGDFDFEAGLMQFDKRAVWDELRHGDTTADEDRLISLNRVKPSSPSASGGRKLLPSENVLERSRLGSQDVDYDDSDEDVDLANPQLLSRNLSKSSVRRLSTGRPSLNLSRQPGSYSRTSPRIQALASPTSSAILSPQMGPTEGLANLRYTETNQICRTMAPETLEAVENLAHNGFSMSEDVLAENAGRGIAEIVLHTINPKGQRLGAQRSVNALPVVVILAGDNRAGARALAAARHLLERNIRVVASLTGKVDLESGPLSTQMHRFKGKILRSWAETSAYVRSLDAPPELIIDALLGVHSRFVDMDADHIETAMDMISWANKSKANVLAVDIPSGIDSSTGQVEVREGEPCEIRAKIIACCGAPCTGLLQALTTRRNEDEWRMYVIDIGINPAARPFLRVNTSSRDAAGRGKYIHFGNGWITGLKYDAGVVG